MLEKINAENKTDVFKPDVPGEYDWERSQFHIVSISFPE